MKIHLLTIGNKMPAWVEAGYQEYAKRLPASCQLVLHEIPAEKRSKQADLARIQHLEGEKLLAAIPKNALVVVLAIKGKVWSTEQLSTALDGWLHGGQDVALMIGGPEGLSPACYQRADVKWSLSPLTFPHPLVRVILAEQLYRAHSLLQNHPYHK